MRASLMSALPSPPRDVMVNALTPSFVQSREGLFASFKPPWTRPSILRNVCMNWLSMAVTMASTLLLTPLIVRTLTTELYGVWSFLNGLFTYTDLLYFGLGASLVKYAAQHIARNDTTGLNRLCYVVFSIYVVVGLASFTFAAALAPFASSLFGTGLRPGSATAAEVTCAILGFRLFSLFVTSAFAGALTAADRMDVARGIGVVFTLVRLVLTPVVLRSASPLVSLAVLVSVTAGCETLLTAWAAASLLRIRPRVVMPHLAELRLLYGFGLQSFLIIMAVKLISYTDQTVVGTTLGAAAVAFYVLPLQLIEYGRGAINSIVAVILPRLTVLDMNDDAAGLQSAYLDVSRIAGAGAAFINVHLMVLGPSFLSVWVGAPFGAQARFILVCLGVSSVLQAVSTQAAIPFLQATGRLRFPAAVLAVEGVVNLALSLVLVRRFGVNGVALGTIVPALLITFAILPAYVCRVLHLNILRLVGSSLLPATGVAVIALAGLLAARFVLPGDSYTTLAAQTFISSAVVVMTLVAARLSFDGAAAARVADRTAGCPEVACPAQRQWWHGWIDHAVHRG